MEPPKATPAPARALAELTLTPADDAQGPAAPCPAQRPAQGQQRRSREGDTAQGCRGGTEGPRGSVTHRGHQGPSLARLELLGRVGHTRGRGEGGLPEGDTGKPCGATGGTVGDRDPAGLSPVGSCCPSTRTGLVRQSCWPVLAPSEEARKLQSPPQFKTGHLGRGDPFHLLSQTPAKTRRLHVPYHSCQPSCPR